ncbi:MAG: hypothetical protein RL728_1106 [Bacteroidota bacterium]|jgi:hypothetical protein
MDIKKLEVSFLKVSEIKSGDVVIVRMSPEEKNKLNKENITEIYNQIKNIVGKEKEVGIFFFSKDMELSYIKDYLKQSEQFFTQENDN